MCRTVLFMFLVTGLSSIACSAELYGPVVSISDGDTLTLLTAENKQLKVRLGSIDAPEKNQPYGNAARQALASKVFQKAISVKTHTTDRYGRAVGVATMGERNINRELVSEGHAWAYQEYLTDRYMIRAEKSARDKKLGLWRLQADQIQAPWEWRKKGRLQRKSSVTDRDAYETSGDAYKCGQKYSCKEMKSCREARFFLNTCRVGAIDRDKDGMPCESLCRKGFGNVL